MYFGPQRLSTDSELALPARMLTFPSTQLAQSSIDRVEWNRRAGCATRASLRNACY